MRRLFSLFMVITLILGLCACNSKEPDMSSDEASSATTSASSDAVTEVSAVETKENAPATTEQSETIDAETVYDCVIVEDIETEYGLIQIPQIDVSVLDSEDVRLANDMFKSIRDRVQERINDCKKEWGDEVYHDKAEPLCVTRYIQNDKLLSITVKYIELYPYSTSMEFNEAVNIELSTGKAMKHHDVIKEAGFTEDEVKAALRFYANRFMRHEWELQTLYANEGPLPDNLDDPSHAWQEELDKLVADYDVVMSPLGEPWDNEPWYDALLHYPTVYAGENGLEVCVRVPTGAGVGAYDAMVHIGHSDSQTMLFNPNTPSGQPFGRGAMPIEAAYEVVANIISTNGENRSISADSMTNIESDEQAEPAYVFRAYTDEGDHYATFGWYAVGVFSGMKWEMDIVSGEWLPIMNGTGLLPEEIYTGAYEHGALATIWSEPGAYGLWAANPCTEVDLVAYGSDSNHNSTDCDTLVLFSIQYNTLVTFETGAMEGDIFVSQSQLWSLTLDIGESVAVYLNRTDLPTQAITVSINDDVGTCILGHNGSERESQIEYITSGSAAE